MQNKNQQPDNHIDYFAPKILWTILIVLLLVVVVAAAYWYQEEKKTEQSSLGTSNKQQENSTAEWKTYTNAEHGFEFKYPSSFEVSKKNRVSSLDKLDTNGKVVEEGPFGTTIGPIEIAVLSSTTLRDRADLYYRSYSISNDKGPGLYCVEEKIDTSMIKALDCKGENGGAIVALIKSNQYDVWFNAGEMQDRSQIKQILSTFKFVGPEGNVIDVPNGKKYSNSKYGFEFQYPSDWKFEENESFGAPGFLVSRGESRLMVLPKGEFDYGPPFEEPVISEVNLAGRKAELTRWKNAGQDEKGELKWYSFTETPTDWIDGHRLDLFAASQTDLKALDQIISTFKFTK